MEELDDQESAFGLALPPALVSLTLFTPSVLPSLRRLSSCFTQPSKPVRAKRQLAWVSLQGRLVGAEKATSAKIVDKNGAFSAKEAAAWELFTPIQRVLVVAVVAAAAINSKKNEKIFKLQKSVEFRDQILVSTQQKLEALCHQADYFKDHSQPPNDALEHTSAKRSKGDEVFKYKSSLTNVIEPEERDLSDWAPSVSSSVVDMQLDDLANERDDIMSLQKECEEKDATIKKLSTLIQSSEVFGSKRIAELVDIIRRKNMIINKLRKEILFLERKVLNLTRLQRPSFSDTSSNVKQLPIMADNVLYDMDCTTSPSSSGSDSSPRNQIKRPARKKSQEEIYVQITKQASKGDHKCGHLKSSKFMRSRGKSPLRERSINLTHNSLPALRQKLTLSGENRTRR